MKCRFTFSELVSLEKLVELEHKACDATPEYSDTWRPKNHWQQHCALDIYRFGPARLLMCMMKERKNKDFKAGCKRSNFHNPAKATGAFWVDQSDYQLRKKQKCISEVSSPKCVAEGQLLEFLDVLGVSHLQGLLGLSLSASIQMLSSVQIHKVFFGRGAYALLGSASERVLCFIEQIVQCDIGVFLWLRKYPGCLQTDEWGCVFADVPKESQHYTLVAASKVVLTSVWHASDESVPGRFRFIIKC